MNLTKNIFFFSHLTKKKVHFRPWITSCIFILEKNYLRQLFINFINLANNYPKMQIKLQIKKKKILFFFLRLKSKIGLRHDLDLTLVILYCWLLFCQFFYSYILYALKIIFRDINFFQYKRLFHIQF